MNRKTGRRSGTSRSRCAKAIAEHKLPPGYNVKYDLQIKTLEEQNDRGGKLSFARLFRRRRLEKPVLVSAGVEEEAAPARVVNG